MALRTTITSNSTGNEISVYENTEQSLTMLIQNLSNKQQFSVFCFECIEDAVLGVSDDRKFVDDFIKDYNDGKIKL